MHDEPGDLSREAGGIPCEGRQIELQRPDIAREVDRLRVDCYIEIQGRAGADIVRSTTDDGSDIDGGSPGDVDGANIVDLAADAAGDGVGPGQCQRHAAVDLQRAIVSHGVVRQRHRAGHLHRAGDGERAARERAVLDDDAAERDVVEGEIGVERHRAGIRAATREAVEAGVVVDRARCGNMDEPAQAAAAVVDGAAVDGDAGQRQRVADGGVHRQGGAACGIGEHGARHRVVVERQRPIGIDRHAAVVEIGAVDSAIARDLDRAP